MIYVSVLLVRRLDVRKICQHSRNGYIHILISRAELNVRRGVDDRLFVATAYAMHDDLVFRDIYLETVLVLFGKRFIDKRNLAAGIHQSEACRSVAEGISDNGASSWLR